MKKLMFIFLLAFSSCVVSTDKVYPPSPEFKYEIGDVVYLKPDSTLAVITDRDSAHFNVEIKTNTYRIGLVTNNGMRYYNIYDNQIYGKK